MFLCPRPAYFLVSEVAVASQPAEPAVSAVPHSHQEGKTMRNKSQSILGREAGKFSRAIRIHRLATVVALAAAVTLAGAEKVGAQGRGTRIECYLQGVRQVQFTDFAQATLEANS